MTTALELRGVVKRYGRLCALDGLDLTVPCGSIFGLVGSNGAGKTTAMAVTVGLLHPAAGRINVLGNGPFCPEHHAGRVSLLPQDSRFPPHARVEDLLRFYGRLQGLPANELSKSIESVLDWVHLTDRRRSSVRTLSHGMNRRLAIAQAFLGMPQLVLLDEPLNGLDPREAARVRDLIRERRGQLSVVISSHNLSDIEALCDTVAFIERGRLVRQDALDTIVRRSHRVTYVLAKPLATLDLLRKVIPDAVWDQSVDGTTINATFTAPLTAERLNAAVLECLLHSQAGILEVRRGSDLESEYLRMAPPAIPVHPGEGQ